MFILLVPEVPTAKKGVMSAPGCCVVVTGAASGIGRAVSIELERRGHVTALWDMDKVCVLVLAEKNVQLGNPERCHNLLD